MKKTFVFMFITSSAVWGGGEGGKALPQTEISGNAKETVQNLTSSTAAAPAATSPSMGGQAIQPAHGKIPSKFHSPRHLLETEKKNHKKVQERHRPMRSIEEERKAKKRKGIYEKRYLGEVSLESSYYPHVLRDKIKNIRPRTPISIAPLSSFLVEEIERPVPISAEVKRALRKAQPKEQTFLGDSVEKLRFFGSQRDYRRFNFIQFNLLYSSFSLWDNLNLLKEGGKYRLARVKIDTDFTTPPELLKILGMIFAYYGKNLEHVEINCKYDPLETRSLVGRMEELRTWRFPCDIPPGQNLKKLKSICIKNSLFVEPLKERILRQWKLPPLKEFKITEVKDWAICACLSFKEPGVFLDIPLIWREILEKSGFRTSPVWELLELNRPLVTKEQLKELEGSKGEFIEKLKALKEKNPRSHSLASPVSLEELGFSDGRLVLEELGIPLINPLEDFPNEVKSEDGLSVDKAKFLAFIEEQAELIMSPALPAPEAVREPLGVLPQLAPPQVRNDDVRIHIVAPGALELRPAGWTNNDRFRRETGLAPLDLMPLQLGNNDLRTPTPVPLSPDLVPPALTDHEDQLREGQENFILPEGVLTPEEIRELLAALLVPRLTPLQVGNDNDLGGRMREALLALEQQRPNDLGNRPFPDLRPLDLTDHEDQFRRFGAFEAFPAPGQALLREQGSDAEEASDAQSLGSPRRSPSRE